MLIYHGSNVAIKNPNAGFGRSNLDFGRGFYATTLKDQAEKWALRRAVMMSGKAFVSVYEFDLTGLDILAFDGYSEEWLDFVVLNRAGENVVHKHDAIFGNIANDDVAAVVNDYMLLLQKGRITAEDKRFFLRQLQFSKPNNQYCIVSDRGISAISFIESYRVEGN